MPRGPWYWFWCAGCRWNGVRCCNTRRCPECLLPVKRMRRAKPAEIAHARAVDRMGQAAKDAFQAVQEALRRGQETRAERNAG
jgi:hypothetical protein